jgi:hypothetical protein
MSQRLHKAMDLRQFALDQLAFAADVSKGL